MSTISGVRPSAGAVASGTLGAVPLAHALVYIRHKRLSGVLDMRSGATRHACLVLRQGFVVSSMTTPAVARFGMVAWEMGLINGPTLDRTTIEALDRKRPHAEVLVESGAITTAQRDAVLVEQTRQRVHHLFTLPPTTTFTFRECAPSTSEPAVAVDLLAPVWRGLCDGPPDERAAEILARLVDAPLELVSDAALQHAELTAEERALCNSLAARGPLTLAQLRDATALPAPRVDLLVYLLVIARSIEVDGAARAVVPSSAMWAAAQAEPVDTEHAAEHASSDRATAIAPSARGPLDFGELQIKERAANLQAETPCVTLGVAEGASLDASRAAFFRLRRLWHPDRVPASLEGVRAEIALIFAHMTQAHRLLAHRAARAVVARKAR